MEIVNQFACAHSLAAIKHTGTAQSSLTSRTCRWDVYSNFTYSIWYNDVKLNEFTFICDMCVVCGRAELKSTYARIQQRHNRTVVEYREKKHIQYAHYCTLIRSRGAKNREERQWRWRWWRRNNTTNISAR